MKTDKISISVVVPMYNAEKFVDCIVPCLMNQTQDNIEIILVNDGSKDNTLAKLQEYAQKDDRIRIIDKENGGVSTARNSGMDIAKGEYVWFVDADDFVYPECAETMYKEVENRDFLISGWFKSQKRDMVEKNVGRKKVVNERIIANNLLEMKENLPFSGWIGVIWRCLFKTSVLKDNNIHFRQIKHEDTLFLYEYLEYCKSCVKIDYEGYVYMDTPNSLGSSHKYNVNEQWLELAMAAAKRCVKAYNISEDSEWIRTLHVLYNIHCVSFVTTGYHNDSKLSYSKRMERWNYLANNQFWKEANIYHSLTKTSKIFWYLSKYRLFYMFDPLLLLITRIHDR